jgi:hypothetical protein
MDPRYIAASGFFLDVPIMGRGLESPVPAPPDAVATDASWPPVRKRFRP